MLVSDLRQRLVAKVGEVAGGGWDEKTIGAVLAYSRAVLVALARHNGDRDVDIEELRVGTATAATILGLHPEYVRFLVRHEELEATKENGEFRIPLSDIVVFSGDHDKPPFRSTLGSLELWPYDLWTHSGITDEPGEPR